VLSLYYPSLAVNGNGDVVIAFTGSSPDHFPSAYAVVGYTNSGTTTFGSIALIARGNGAWTGNRWGDYSSTVVDPSDSTKFWTFQELVNADDQWAVNVTEIKVTSTSVSRPLTQDDAYHMNEDTTLTTGFFHVLSNDSDPGSLTLTASLVRQPAHGLLTLNSNGHFTYVPHVGYNGTDWFEYQATNGTNRSVPTRVTIKVRAINEQPVRTGGTVSNLTVLEDSGATALGLSGLNYGPGGGDEEAAQVLTYTVTAVPSASLGTIVLADGTTTVTASTTYTLAQIQGMKFKTATNANGGPATFTWSVQDNGGTANGGVDTLNETISITVTAVNDAPSFTKGPNLPDGTIIVDIEDEDQTTLSYPAWATNISAGPADESSQTLSFSVSVSIPSLFMDTPAVAIDGTDPTKGNLTFRPAPNVEGTATVTVTLNDNGGTANSGQNSYSQTFTIIVTKPHYWHNSGPTSLNNLDANGDGDIRTSDVAAVINYINAFGAGAIPQNATIGGDNGNTWLDVNGDNFVVAADALDIINYLNAYYSEHPRHNGHDPLDVDADGFINATDATLVIDYLNGPGSTTVAAGDYGPDFYDVNQDNYVSPIDAVLIINWLNTGKVGGTVYVDLDNDGVLDLEEPRLAGVEIHLDYTLSGQPYQLVATTDINGHYLFGVPGSVTNFYLREVQPSSFLNLIDGQESVGTSDYQVTANDEIYVTYASSARGWNANFGERLNNITDTSGLGFLLGEQSASSAANVKSLWTQRLNGWTNLKSAKLVLDAGGNTATLYVTDLFGSTYTVSGIKKESDERPAGPRFRVVSNSNDDFIFRIVGGAADFGLLLKT
jgi:hypothetical protein